jgi:hypothetical protein
MLFVQDEWAEPGGMGDESPSKGGMGDESPSKGGMGDESPNKINDNNTLYFTHTIFYYFLSNQQNSKDFQITM